MINMERKYKQDLKFHEMYTATINDYIKQGHAIKVTSEKSERSSSIINYLPHHGVRNINKPGGSELSLTQVPNLKIHALTTTS